MSGRVSVKGFSISGRTASRAAASAVVSPTPEGRATTSTSSPTVATTATAKPKGIRRIDLSSLSVSVLADAASPSFTEPAAPSIYKLEYIEADDSTIPPKNRSEVHEMLHAFSALLDQKKFSAADDVLRKILIKGVSINLTESAIKVLLEAGYEEEFAGVSLSAERVDSAVSASTLTLDSARDLGSASIRSSTNISRGVHSSFEAPSPYIRVAKTFIRKEVSDGKGKILKGSGKDDAAREAIKEAVIDGMKPILRLDHVQYPSGGTVVSKDKVRLDIQGYFTETSGRKMVNYQVQINKPRASGESTTMAAVMIQQPETSAIGFYEYPMEMVIGAFLESRATGNIVHLYSDLDVSASPRPDSSRIAVGGDSSGLREATDKAVSSAAGSLSGSASSVVSGSKLNVNKTTSLGSTNGSSVATAKLKLLEPVEAEEKDLEYEELRQFMTPTREVLGLYGVPEHMDGKTEKYTHSSAFKVVNLARINNLDELRKSSEEYKQFISKYEKGREAATKEGIAKILDFDA